MTMKEMSQPWLSALAQGRLESDEPHLSIGERLGKVLGLGKEDKKPDVEVNRIRGVEPRDYLAILRWIQHPDTKGHLSPLPRIPKWHNPEDVIESTHEMGQYYTNKGEPEKITPLAAVSANDKPLGVVTIRWRGDPWAPKGHKVAMIERLVINPDVRGRGVGTKLVEEALRIVFEEKGFPEARAWVMSDDEARGWGRVIEFFHQFGFDQLQGKDHSWKDYQETRGMEYDGRDAKQLILKKEDWEERIKNQKPTQQTLPLGTQ